MKVKTILHGITALCSALVFAFFALPWYSITVTPEAFAEYGSSYNGYTFLKEALQSTDSTSTCAFATFMALITLIVAGLAFVMAVVALLADFEVIKNEKVVKVLDWAVFAVIVVFALSCILNLVGNLVLVANDVQDGVDLLNYILESYGATATSSAGWALTILTLICGLGAVGTTSYAKFKK